MFGALSPGGVIHDAGPNLAALALGLSICYAYFTGPRDLSLYPARHESPYCLPWPAGLHRLCVQGNRAVVSHRGDDEYAYDFAMPVGSDVCAARGGVVTRVEDSHDGNGFDRPSNFVAIRHDDGTTAWYVHLMRGGSLVRPGRRVERGERIARSGNVGHSLMPHLHFHVVGADGRRRPITFHDVERDDGIPRMFRTYVSRSEGP